MTSNQDTGQTTPSPGVGEDQETLDRLLPVADARASWAWLARQLGRRKAQTAVMLVVSVVAAVAAVLPVYVFAELVDRVRDRDPASSITVIAVIIVVAAIVGGVTTGLSQYLISRLGETLLASLRERVVERSLTLPASVLERAGKGDLLSRIGDDVNLVGRTVTDVLPTVVSSLLMTIIGLAAMAGLDWRLGLAGLVAAPLYIAGLRWYLPRSAPRYAEQRRAVGRRSQVLVESMVGADTVHAYGLEKRHLDDIESAAVRARDISIEIVTLFTRFVGRTNRAEYVGLSLVLATGFLCVRADLVTVGAATAAALVFHRLFGPVGTVLHSFDEVQSAGASLARLVGVVSIPDDATRPSVPTAHPSDATLELDAVDFRYDDGPLVVRDVSIRIAPGERVALVGSTGAGKSTVAAIAAGLLTPVSGRASIGGVPIADLTDDQARAQVAIVSQEVHVFSGPLVDDVRLARPTATEDEVLRALEVVGARGWVDDLPEGVHTAIGENGREITAASAQQLALARLVLSDPAVAILDEATAEAGSLGARGLEESAAAATEGRTTLVVAHRLTQAAGADRVIVLEHGEIVECGAHADLVAGQGRYAQLWRAWESRADGDANPATPHHPRDTDELMGHR